MTIFRQLASRYIACSAAFTVQALPETLFWRSVRNSFCWSSVIARLGIGKKDTGDGKSANTRSASAHPVKMSHVIRLSLAEVRKESPVSDISTVCGRVALGLPLIIFLAIRRGAYQMQQTQKATITQSGARLEKLRSGPNVESSSAVAKMSKKTTEPIRLIQREYFVLRRNALYPCR